MPRHKAMLFLLSLATACVPASFAQSTSGAVPGSINFIQGQANIDGQPLQNTAGVNGKTRQLHTGETIATANGTADILIASGALLRIGQDSTVRMVAEGAGRSEIRVEQGLANVSVNVVRRDTLLLVDLPDGQTQLLSRGLYTFNTATNTVRVFNGEADVFAGADTNSDIKPVKVKEGHELVLNGDGGAERAKPASFDREVADNDLLPWTGPKESRAALTDASVRQDNAYPYTDAGYAPGAYGFYGGPYAFGDPYLGYGDPYGWGPYGFYGYPFFGVGFGYWGGGFYRGPVFRGPVFRGPVRGGGIGGFRGGYGGGIRGGYAGHAFAGGHSFGRGGFGGFHGGGGHR